MDRVMIPIHFLFGKHRRYTGSSPRPDLSQERKALFVEQRGVCFFCGKECTWSGFTVDHIIPRCRGGTDDLENLKGACSECNYLRNRIELDLAVGRPLEPCLLEKIPMLLPVVKEKHLRELMCGVEVE
jgi:hypothetical protein